MWHRISLLHTWYSPTEYCLPSIGERIVTCSSAYSLSLNLQCAINSNFRERERRREKSLFTRLRNHLTETQQERVPKTWSDRRLVLILTGCTATVCHGLPGRQALRLAYGAQWWWREKIETLCGPAHVVCIRDLVPIYVLFVPVTAASFLAIRTRCDGLSNTTQADEWREQQSE